MSQPDHPVWTQLFSKQVGPGKLLRDQAELRKKAKVGSQQIAALKKRPDELDDDVLLKLADAAELDPKDVAKLLEREFSDDEIRRLRSGELRTFSVPIPQRGDKPFFLYQVDKFFSLLGQRSINRRFLQAVSFTSDPHMLTDAPVQREIVNLLTQGMCYAAYVPIPCKMESKSKPRPCEGSGEIHRRYGSALASVRKLLRSLILSAPEQKQEEVTKRIALFVLQEKFAALPFLRAVLPHDDAGRKFLVKLPPDPTRVESTSVIIARWLRSELVSDARHGVIEIMYDLSEDQYRRISERHFQERNELEEYFQYAIRLWENGGRQQFGDAEKITDDMWLKVDIDVNEVLL